MRRLRLLTPLLAAVALLCATLTTAPALAAGNPVLNDCGQHGKLDHHYSIGALRHALTLLSAESKEYTDCQDVIQQAILTARHVGGAGPITTGSSGSSLSTPLIIIIVVLVLGAVTFGALAVRRRRGDGGGPGAGAGPGAGGGPGGGPDPGP